MPHDPGKRKEIHEYDHNQIDEVRRKYLTIEPCQPRSHSFKQRVMAGALRRFNPSWFDQYSNWLEYIVKKEKAYCFLCYLFSNEKKTEVLDLSQRDFIVGTSLTDWLVM